MSLVVIEESSIQKKDFFFFFVFFMALLLILVSFAQSFCTLLAVTLVLPLEHSADCMTAGQEQDFDLTIFLLLLNEVYSRLTFKHFALWIPSLLNFLKVHRLSSQVPEIIILMHQYYFVKCITFHLSIIFPISMCYFCDTIQPFIYKEPLNVPK